MSRNQDGLTFRFDRIFDQHSSQLNIYEFSAKNAVNDALEGYNSTIMAYGSTGSGKTHTIFGSDILDEQQMGIIPRVSRDVFQKIT